MAIHMSKQQWLRVATAAAAATIAVVFLAVAPAQKGPSPTRRSASGVLRRDDIATVAREQKDAVVSLHTLREVSSDELRGLPPWLRIEPLQEGLGSGFIIDAAGLILTNAHVVENADVVHVRTPNGENVDAEVVGRDPEDDLALLRAVGITSPPVALGDSDRIEVGDWVVAIGNPLGLHHTVTAGIISAKARGIDQSGLEFLQTDSIREADS